MSELYFPSLSSQKNSFDGPKSSAELQANLCGLLCMKPDASRNNWLNTLYPDVAFDEQQQQDARHLFDITLQSLNSLDFDLQLALPDDDVSLSSRILAVADWCQGLLFGLAVSGLSDDHALSKDCQEYINDVSKISQVSDDIAEEDNQDALDFEEIVEYLRMGVFLLFSELQPLNPDPDFPTN